MRLAVIDVCQAVGTVPLIFERAVVVRGADRTGFSRQILVRNRIRAATRIGGRYLGTVDRDRTVYELILRGDFGSADEEGIARLIFSRIIIQCVVCR